MHQKKVSPNTNPLHPPPPSSSDPTHLTRPTPDLEIHYQKKNEPPLFPSTPHKRPLMPRSSTPSHSQTLSSLHDSPFKASSHPPFPCSCSLPLLLATKRITLRLLHHSCRASWLRLHTKLFILLFLPTFYLLTTAYYRYFLFFLVCAVFLFLLVIALSLALPAIRHFFISKIKPAPSKTHLPVVWSIGAKPKLECKLDSGCWVQIYSNGDLYEGEFHKGKCSGSGVHYYHLTGRYEGDWVDGKYDGYGVETWAKGSRYRGQYLQGLRHGVGLYRSYTGDAYAGEWCNGQCHGQGIHTCEDGSSYIGEFKWGVKHGLGTYQFRNADNYAGEYFADKMHGFGVYRFGNGHRYEGAWHEGRRQGFGTYTFRNEQTQTGHWQNGVLNVSSGGSSMAYDHRSKVLHAVQAQLDPMGEDICPNPP
ncbi:unnamed protein product [Cuscuta epithymum]|uniref:Uncharacterized protein n=1 Tax=Cuscuta epithymum TaxID=186058 RepID=A0AAV0GE89_9ASTE|nr:unnamed protein product [Cuscuta epithymum]